VTIDHPHIEAIADEVSKRIARTPKALMVDS
jgi:hypothetical protein